MIKVIRIIILLLTIFSGLAIAGCSSGTVSEPVPVPSREAPDFQLQSLDGQTVSLSGLRGRPVILNFWATWCGPCRLEMPHLQAASEDARWTEQGLVILAVNLGESTPQVESFMEDNGLSFPVLLDTELEVARLYNASSIPVTYFIDRNGIIRDMKIGPFTKKADIDWRLVNSILEDV